MDTVMYNPQSVAAAIHRIMDTLNSIRDIVLCFPLPSALTSAVTATMVLGRCRRCTIRQQGAQLYRQTK